MKYVVSNQEPAPRVSYSATSKINVYMDGNQLVKLVGNKVVSLG